VNTFRSIWVDLADIALSQDESDALILSIIKDSDE
jgi:hypothetical protein